ncbi:hypothetical protein [Neobacillus massiliamazoniensis]|uniref:Uncharacterized protein n=1 Tax=Neobacillus massiliamazoniensis TaxID=1499688 RepID=A0A0U1NZF3_9BACI|nr:hypothetical protein [Neobacillus massiliamazoniensis]CRK83409.1 hypothetical protein BN000_03377 [Neobacillus massiliamazoniensis]
MSKSLLSIVSAPLVVVQLFILYFWIFDWKKLVTETGLIVWVSSILLGVIIYLLYRRLNTAEKSIVVTKRIVFTSTLITVLLGFFALIIEFTVSSMP